MTERTTETTLLESRTGPIERPDLPLPRLQLRWTLDTASGSSTCHYELAFRIGDDDRRGDGAESQTTITLGQTERESSGTEWAGDPADMRPYGDGRHAALDSANLHDLPIYVIAPDGRAARYRPERERAKPAATAAAKPVPARLTARQIDAIRHGRDKGGGIFVPGSSAGGAIYRMCENLAKMGLLSPSPPFPATKAGIALLREKGL